MISARPLTAASGNPPAMPFGTGAPSCLVRDRPRPPWYITGQSDARFDDDVLHELDVITGRDLEVVDASGLVSGP